ncbi:MAG TPA: nucleoside deaminase [bacterium]|nr:nucleoside deaminase [bacterium]HPJ72246.1 nucleoside deaminase [bacterium]HPQ66638.1 nucleoside deaminase [bacterium]
MTQNPKTRRPGREAGCDPVLISRLLELMENEIVPLTRREVARGNKIFGAAVLKKGDLSTVVVGSNNEIENPLWHGEVHTIKLLYELPRDLRPHPRDLIFFSTHEPCPLCLSAIAWAGFDVFYYFFSHEDSRDSFGIGHDLAILKEVFKQEPGGYARSNRYWTGYGLKDLIAACAREDREAFADRVGRLEADYERLSGLYQANKARIDSKDIPLR